MGSPKSEQPDDHLVQRIAAVFLALVIICVLFYCRARSPEIRLPAPLRDRSSPLFILFPAIAIWQSVKIEANETNLLSIIGQPSPRFIRVVCWLILLGSAVYAIKKLIELPDSYL